MNKIYLTEVEKKEITDIQIQENDYMVQLGQIEYQIQSLKLQKITIGEELKNGIKSASVPSKRLASVDATQCIMPDAMRYIKIKTYPMTELKKLCTSLK